MTLSTEERKKWLHSIGQAGWVVIRNGGDRLHIRCGVQDCRNKRAIPIGAKVRPCEWDHSGRFRQLGVERYEDLSEILRARRMRLGLTQEEASAAAGLADGHVSKLEADVRTSSLPTLILWANALGLDIRLVPAPIPSSTISILCDRVGRPRAAKPRISRRPPRRGSASRQAVAPSSSDSA